MALDGVTNTTSGFDPVRRNRALDEIFRPDAFLFTFEETDEHLTDDLALLLRVRDPVQGLEVTFTRMQDREFDPDR